MSHSSGRQRNFALALGVDPGKYPDYDSLSQAMERAKANRKGPPNAGQLRLAKSWGIDLSKSDNGYRATDALYAHIQCQAFIYSVARKLLNANWRFYSDSKLPQAWAIDTARELSEDDELCSFIMDMENAMSSTQSDAFFRFGKKQALSEAVQIVAHKLNTELPSYVAQERRQPSQPAKRRTKQQSGCAVVLLTLLAIAFMFALATYAHAWNALGHKLVCKIAWDSLDDTTRSEIAATLRRHPRFDEDFAKRMPDVSDEQVFLHAGTWPDIARGIRGPDRAKYNHGTCTTSTSRSSWGQRDLYL